MSHNVALKLAILKILSIMSSRNRSCRNDLMARYRFARNYVGLSETSSAFNRRTAVPDTLSDRSHILSRLVSLLHL